MRLILILMTMIVTTWTTCSAVERVLTFTVPEEIPFKADFGAVNEGDRLIINVESEECQLRNCRVVDGSDAGWSAVGCRFSILIDENAKGRIRGQFAGEYKCPSDSDGQGGSGGGGGQGGDDEWPEWTGTSLHTICELKSSVEGGANEFRTTLGLAEYVALKVVGNTASVSEWKITGGRFIFEGGRSAQWQAPCEPGDYTVTAEFSDGSNCELEFTVIPPEDIVYTKQREMTFEEMAGILGAPPGTQDWQFLGAGMFMDMVVEPTSVNFSLLGFREVPGPAVKVRDEYNFIEQEEIAHVTTGLFAYPDSSNKLTRPDRATTGLAPNEAWLTGGYQWEIPLEYICLDPKNIVRMNATVTQTHDSDKEKRSFTITKDGKSVTRVAPEKPEVNE